jgi:hypothetical protein
MTMTYEVHSVKRSPKAAKSEVYDVPVQQKQKQKQQRLVTWDQEVRSFWLRKMKENPDLYDDACISHTSGKCRCRCTPDRKERPYNQK